MDLNWSKETYRLDQIDQKFSLPCVVQVSEGIYRETEAESFSAGDIIKIDKHTRIPKIVSNFAENPYDGSEARGGISNILKTEIHVPLNYKGKVKVVNTIKDFYSVKDLVKEFPRYAIVKQAIKVEEDQKRYSEVKSGTLIELDRVIPGSSGGNSNTYDQLLVRYQDKGVQKIGLITADKKGRFRTSEDRHEYTIKEVVERFPLPQTVHFLKNDLQRIYMDSLVDMAENFRTYTDTLKLKRLVSQEVLIGHYKPLEETGNHAHRTVVVLPLDAPYVRDIEVNVLEEATEEDYEKLQFVPVPRRAVESVAEMIYVDFSNSPGFINLDAENYDNSEFALPKKPKPAIEYNVPPPRPPKPKPKPLKAARKPATQEKENNKAVSPAPVSIPETQDDNYEAVTTPPVSPDRSTYIKMDAKKSPPSAGPTEDDGYLDPPYFDLASYDFNAKGKLPQKATRKKTFLSKMKKKLPSKLYSSHKETKRLDHSLSQPEPDHQDSEESDGDNYETIDPDYPHLSKPKTNSLNRFFPRQSPSGAKQTSGTPESAIKPTAFVAPHSSAPSESVDEAGDKFEELSIKQTYKRLMQCGMRDFAEICKKENLDGNFISSTSVDTLKKEPFSLNDFDILKLDRVKQNWIPK